MSTLLERESSGKRLILVALLFDFTIIHVVKICQLNPTFIQKITEFIHTAQSERIAVI